MTEGSHRHHDRQESRFIKFLRAYGFELACLIIALFAIFLVFERMSIRSTLTAWNAQAMSSVLHWAGHIDQTAQQVSRWFTLSNAIAAVLLLGVLVATAWRIRWRLMRNSSLTTLLCPKCNGNLHQVHRKWYDKALNWYIPFRRYRCFNRECRWSGLRIKPTKTRSAKGVRASLSSAFIWIVLLIVVAVLLGAWIALSSTISAPPSEALSPLGQWL